MITERAHISHVWHVTKATRQWHSCLPFAAHSKREIWLLYKLVTYWPRQVRIDAWLSNIEGNSSIYFPKLDDLRVNSYFKPYHSRFVRFLARNLYFKSIRLLKVTALIDNRKVSFDPWMVCEIFFPIVKITDAFGSWSLNLTYIYRGLELTLDW